MGTAVGFKVMTPPVLFVVLLIPKAPAAVVTFIVADAVEPAAVAVTVAVPMAGAPVPETVTANFPLASVVPDVGLSVSWPPVVVTQDTVYGVPTRAAPCAFLAMKVMVAGDVPSLGTLEPVVPNTESVEPSI